MRGRAIILTAGSLLLIAALAGSFHWFYRLGPARHLSDREWRSKHSETDLWREEQRDYRRTGNSPDLCIRGDRIGVYGDRKWFLWLMERIQNPEEFRVCGCTETALWTMSNQHPDAWEDWLTTNRNRSQEEWIQQGFARYGVLVDLPPRSGDVTPLLRLLGKKGRSSLMAGLPASTDSDVVPDFVQYNAFRFLRDAGFDANEFNLTVTNAPLVAAGLKKFAEFLKIFPGTNGLGALSLSRSLSASGK